MNKTDNFDKNTSCIFRFHLHARFHDNHHKLIESTAIGPGGVRTLGRHITRARWKFTTHPDRLLRTIIGEGAKFESNHQSLSPKTIICQGGKISPKTTLKYHLQGRKVWENFPQDNGGDSLLPKTKYQKMTEVKSDSYVSWLSPI